MTESESKRAYNRRIHETGVCIRCRNPLEPERSEHLLCAACQDEEVDRKRRIRLERVQNGTCVRCGIAPARKGRQMCFRCSMLCHESYERRKSRLGIFSGKMGRRPVYRYIVSDGDEVIFRGTAQECSERFGILSKSISQDERNGHRILGKYPVTRERIDGGDGDV